MKNSITKGLQFKITSVLAVLFIIILSGLTIFNSIEFKGKVIAEIQEAFQVMTETLMNGIHYPMSVNNSRAIKAQMQNINKNMAGFKVYILDFDQQVAYASEINQVGSSLAEQGVADNLRDSVKTLMETGLLKQKFFHETVQGKPIFTVLRPIENESGCYHCHGKSHQILGCVMIRKDISAVHAVIKKAWVKNILVGFVGFLLIIAALFFMFSRLVSKPMRRCVAFAEGTAAGDYTQTLDMDQQDEIGIMASALNKM
ncbi:MAG: HAMP domain-containing protein, partial [Deltaproteobacteria bacterium]|nr:HAMP domain-containing protein [Deltaproteobacteria bacterium]